jgi:hypothetical protein
MQSTLSDLVYRVSLSLSLSRRQPHRTALLHRITATTSLAAGDHAPRGLHARGRASFLVGGSQLRRNKEDLLGSSKEKKKKASICTFTHLSVDL